MQQDELLNQKELERLRQSSVKEDQNLALFYQQQQAKMTQTVADLKTQKDKINATIKKISDETATLKDELKNLGPKPSANATKDWTEAKSALVNFAMAADRFANDACCTEKSSNSAYCNASEAIKIKQKLGLTVLKPSKSAAKSVAPPAAATESGGSPTATTSTPHASAGGTPSGEK